MYAVSALAREARSSDSKARTRYDWPRSGTAAARHTIPCRWPATHVCWSAGATFLHTLVEPTRDSHKPREVRALGLKSIDRASTPLASQERVLGIPGLPTRHSHAGKSAQFSPTLTPSRVDRPEETEPLSKESGSGSLAFS